MQHALMRTWEFWFTHRSDGTPMDLADYTAIGTVTNLAARLCAEAFLARVPAGTDYVGGLEMGAVPVIAALAAISDVAGRPVKTFFVRKAAKGHGTNEVVVTPGTNNMFYLLANP